tara:strand:- start:2429 stop:2539 length:111 start_codon:yes stop_codon:yes gene_type:complete
MKTLLLAHESTQVSKAEYYQEKWYLSEKEEGSIYKE